MRKINLVGDSDHRFAQAFNAHIQEVGLTLLEVSDKTGVSYEHVRKLSRGLACPSRLMLKALCDALQLDHHEMTKLVTVDRIHSQFGHIPEEIVGKNPALAKIESMWPLLSDEQRACLEAQAQVLVEMNKAKAIAHTHSASGDTDNTETLP
jgi:predicted transcriptional regulator